MSWIIGVIGSDKNKIKEKIISISPKPLVEFDENDLIIKSGGNYQTCFYTQRANGADKFIAVGLGIKVNGHENNILDSKSWSEIIDYAQIQDLNGHYILVRWNSTEINIFTDVLGLRDIYFHKYSENTFIFSTRVDWLAKIIRSKLDFREFGSRWLLFNQISSKSVFEGIDRISSGTRIKINRINYQLTKINFNWEPPFDNSEYSTKEFSDTFKKICSLPYLINKKTSLSLSGGMDSRVILSYMMNNKDNNWYAHTFGDSKHPDSLIASKICTELNINHEQINLPFPRSSDECLDEITDYVSHTIVNNAASGFIQLRNYNALINRNEIIIDGGFGEIWRREFFNRLFITGKNALISKKVKEIIPYLTIHRADIFNNEVNQLMLEGCFEQMNGILSELPNLNLIGIENFIDLFALKTRLVNYYSYEQSRLDTLVSSFMPFVQPILLKNLFNVKISQRKNGTILRNIIGKNFPSLKRFPLAKGQNTHPFWLNTVQSRVWNIIYRKIGRELFHDNSSEKLINLFSPFILDTINTRSVIECDYYNISKLNRLSDSLRKKELTQRDIYELDWWLAFELLRENTNIK